MLSKIGSVAPQTAITVVWGWEHVILLCGLTVVAASLNKSAVVTDHVVTDHVEDICSRVVGFLKLCVSKDDDLTYDFKYSRHFLKKILTSKSLKNF
jgi:hypothetical protein